MTNFFLFNSLGALLLLTFLSVFNVRNVNKKGNIWFGFFCFSVFLILFEEELYILKIESELFLAISNLAAFFIAPTFYLSVVYFVNPLKKWKFKDNLHFSFPIFFVIFLIFEYFLNISVFNTNLNESEPTQLFSILFLILFDIQLITYSYFSFKKVVSHQKNIRIFSSNVENLDLQWLKNVIIGVGILFIFWIIAMIIYSSIIDLYLFIAVFIVVYFIAFYTLKQKEIYPFIIEDQNNIITILEETVSNKDPLEKKKLITDEKFNDVKAQLLNYMQTERPYLESELSLIKLSKYLNTTAHILSYVINSGFDESFYQFINKYRIEEAKKFITDPKMNHLSILGIGFEVGFNSKSVFNTIFKKNTGLTPTEFKKTTLK